MADDAIQDIKFLPRDESPEQEAQNIIERRRWSEQYTADLWDELKEVYRGIKCRVEKKKKKNPANSDEMIDDNTSTNVAMPDLNIMHRRNTARLTAQPYRLRYIGGSQPYLAETLSAQASMQYDRSKEAVQDRRLVMYGEAFGFAYSKLFYDDLGFDMNVQRAIMKNNEIVIRDRAAIMRAAGAPPDEIRQAVKEKGRQVSDAEVAEFMGRTGNFIQMQKKVQRYAGPCVKAVFPGDLALQPGCLSVYESDYAIESYQETDLWLKKQTNLTYIHPETGKETYAFDRDAIQRLIDLDPEPDQSRLTLKNLFEEVSDKANRPLWKSLRIRRRYDMLEEHSQDDNGIMWIQVGVVSHARQGAREDAVSSGLLRRVCLLGDGAAPGHGFSVRRFNAAPASVPVSVAQSRRCAELRLHLEHPEKISPSQRRQAHPGAGRSRPVSRDQVRGH
jgi:hypothetical protein